MVLTDEELEIMHFYDEGLSIENIAYCTGRTVYRLKKFLLGGEYIFRQLDEEIPDCSVFGNRT